MQLHGGKVQHGLDARARHAVEHRLRIVGGNGEDGDFRMLLRDVLLEPAHVTDLDALEHAANLVRVGVVGGDDHEPALPEAAILGQRRTDLSRTDDHHAPLLSKPENVAQRRRQLGHGIAQAPLAEGAEERQVLPHLRRRGAPSASELVARDGRESVLPEFLEKAQVDGQPANGGIRDSFQGARRLVN